MKKISIVFFLILCSTVVLAQSKIVTLPIFTNNNEGPAVNAQGDLYVVNFKEDGTIGKVNTQTGEVVLFVKLPDGSVGNGIKFKNNNEFYVADFVNHNILIINILKKSIKVFSHSLQMNQPNDLSITSKGVLFASDPNWKEGTGQVWRCDSDGKLTKVLEGMGTTNGIAVAPKDKYLYVNESVQRKIWRFKLDKNNQPIKKKLIHQFEDFGMDGMRCDKNGVLYVCRYDAGLVLAMNSKGRILKEYKLIGKKPSNIAFGGFDGKTVFITLQDEKHIEKFEVDVPGLEWSRLNALGN